MPKVPDFPMDAILKDEQNFREVAHYNPAAHWVEVEPYGSEGLQPTEGEPTCESRGKCSCISGSGSSMCGGFMGSGIMSGRNASIRLLCINAYPGQILKEGSMIKLYKDGDNMSIVTDAADEYDFLRDVSDALEAIVDSGIYDHDWSFQFFHWLTPIVDICCKYRGYKNNVAEKRVLCSGGTNFPTEKPVVVIENGKAVAVESDHPDPDPANDQG